LANKVSSFLVLLCFPAIDCFTVWTCYRSSGVYSGLADARWVSRISG